MNSQQTGGAKRAGEARPEVRFVVGAEVGGGALPRECREAAICNLVIARR
jgi:hypothetical protein